MSFSHGVIHPAFTEYDRYGVICKEVVFFEPAYGTLYSVHRAIKEPFINFGNFLDSELSSLPAG